MPIKPENKAKYPPNWATEIRPAILRRAKECCEYCGVPNHSVGARDLEGNWHDEHSIDCMQSDHGVHLFGFEFPKIIRIVLTIAHVDHNPENCDSTNLRALCQKCHNQLDAKIRAQHAAQTRADKKRTRTGQLQLL